MNTKFEINGNLDDKARGLENYGIFEYTVCKVRNYFIDHFGQEYIESIPLYTDNATKGSGYTPIITRTLGQCLVIKLNIESNDEEGKIAYQFSHEMMHYVFYVKYGLDKKPADDREETVCSAASLIVMHNLYPNDFVKYNDYVKRLNEYAYRDGAALAEQVEYDLDKLKELM